MKRSIDLSLICELLLILCIRLNFSSGLSTSAALKQVYTVDEVYLKNLICVFLQMYIIANCRLYECTHALLFIKLLTNLFTTSILLEG